MNKTERMEKLLSEMQLREKRIGSLLSQVAELRKLQEHDIIVYREMNLLKDIMAGKLALIDLSTGENVPVPVYNMDTLEFQSIA